MPVKAQQQGGVLVDSTPRVIGLKGSLEVDEIIEVTIEGLDRWAKTQGQTPWRLVPYINERALPGLYPIAVNLKSGKVQFHLSITTANRVAWNNLLSPPVFSRNVQFSVGLETQDQFNTMFNAQESLARLVVVEIEWAIAALLAGTACTFLFLCLVARTSILMERATSTDGRTELRLSLAKVQLAIWFFVIFGAYIGIWLITGDHESMTSSTVAILGISAGTALGDSYIRTNRNLSNQTSTQDSAEPRPLLDKEVPENNLLNKQGFLSSSRKNLIDLISDSDGYSIFRFQMIAWTIALICIFLSSVYYNLKIPDFRPDLLYLLGLSSGTYVANRVPETIREVRNGLINEQRSDEFGRNRSS